MGGLGPIHPSIEIFAEAGPSVGLGHLRRMEFLADLIDEELYTTPSSFLVSASTSSSPATSRRSELLTNRQQLFDQVHAKSLRGKLVILDLKWSEFSMNELVELVGAPTPQRRFLLIDGPEAVLEGNPTRLFPAVAIAEKLRAQSNVIFGPRYSLAIRGGALSNSDTCLVLTGSTAHGGFIDQVNRIASDPRLSDMPFTWGIGPFVTESRFESQLARNVTAVRLPSVGAVLPDYGIALCRFGVSALEALSLGVPTVILPGWKNSEEDSVSEIERLGLALVARSGSEAADWLGELRIDSSLRESLHEASRETFQPDSKHPAIDVIEAIIREIW